MERLMLVLYQIQPQQKLTDSVQINQPTVE